LNRNHTKQDSKQANRHHFASSVGRLFIMRMLNGG
jgi:hypothetical protein